MQLIKPIPQLVKLKEYLDKKLLPHGLTTQDVFEYLICGGLLYFAVELGYGKGYNDAIAKQLIECKNKFGFAFPAKINLTEFIK